MVGAHRLPCETPRAHPAHEDANPTQWILPATILGSSLSFIDSSVVNVALPAIQSGLGAELSAMQWVVNGYMLTLASLILLGGAAGDRFGRRRVFLIGLIGFAATSLACGLAPSAGWLIAARLAQGAAAALLVPSSLAIIGGAYAGEARGRAIGTWAAAGALTTALGPPLGGWLVDAIGWRSIFFINLPVAAIAIWLALKLPADQPAEAGQAARCARRAAGDPRPWPAELWAHRTWRRPDGKRCHRARRGASRDLAFLAGRSPGRTPMMPLTLFRDKTFAGVNALTVVLYAALSGALFLLPFLLIQAHGYSAAAAGAAFLPFSVIMGFGSRWAGGLVESIGARLPLVIGAALVAFGFIVLGVSARNAQLLDRRFSRPCDCRRRHDPLRRPADDDRFRFRAQRAEWGGLRDQQCRGARRWPAGGRRARSRIRRRRRVLDAIGGLGAGLSARYVRRGRSRRPKRADGSIDHRSAAGAARRAVSYAGTAVRQIG